MKTRNITVRQLIIGMAVSISVLWAAATLLANALGPTGVLRESYDHQVGLYNDVFRSQLDSDSQSLAKTLTALTRDPALVDPFVKGDRDVLMARALPIFEELKKKYDITHLYAIERDGKTFLRVHNPARHGDPVTRATFQQAKATGALGKGIEMGAAFFSLRVVMPVHRDGEIVGYFELGQELDHLVSAFSAATNAGVSMWLNESYARNKKVTDKFAKVGSYYRVMASDAKAQEALMAKYGASGHGSRSEFAKLELGGAPFGAKAFPFRDASGEEAGVILFSYDISRVEGTLATFNMTMVTVSILFLVLSVGFGLWIARRVALPLRHAVQVAEALAKGDLAQRVEVRRSDETGQLLSALKGTNAQLTGIIRGIKDSAHTIAEASKEIARGNIELSSRTEEQASSLEETASSMEEFASTVKQNTQNARHASELAAGASQVAVKGGQAVGQVVANMSSINDSSKKIADITGVIDTIAFQTNILALNAAVEAARAGESGRGFAVVASEVRSLAQRSATAAKEIKALISDSVARVEGGTRLANEAGKTMDEIAAAVGRVTDVIGEIALASQEQNAGIEQISRAVTQMDQVTQQNATQVEEVAAAAESMKEQAAGLARAVSVFNLPQLDGPAGDSPAPVASRLAPRAHPAVVGGRDLAVAGHPVPKLAAAVASGDGWQEF